MNPSNKNKFENNRNIVTPQASKPKKWYRFWPAALILVLVVGAVVGIRNYSSGNVTIGDTTITKKDIQLFTDDLKQLKESNPSVVLEGDLEQEATNRLIYNAALKVEAKKYGINITDDDLNENLGKNFSSDQEKKDYFNELRNQKSTDIINLENQALRNKLSDKILAKKQFLVANIAIDTPYFSSIPQDKVQGEYDKARKRLETNIIPLLKSGASKADLEKKVDTVWYKADGSNQDLILYLKQAVLALDEINDFQTGATEFNDINEDAYLRGANPGKLVDTAKSLDKLKNVGDVGEIFVSKTGALMVARLEKKTGGSFDTWDDFLGSYKDKYIGHKLSVVDDVKSNIASTVNISVKSLTSPGLKKAQAQVADSTCSSHYAYFILVAFDSVKDVYLSGAKIKTTRAASDRVNYQDGSSSSPADTCGNTGNFYAVSSGNRNKTTGEWHRSGGDGNEGDNTIHDSCWNTPLRSWDVVTHPAGYKHDGYQSDDKGEPFKWANIPDGNVYHRDYESAAQEPMKNFDFSNPGFKGWPVWNSANTNKDSDLIVLRYRTLPTPTTDVCTNLAGIQATVPSGYTKDTPGNTPGKCVKPPPKPDDIQGNINVNCQQITGNHQIAAASQGANRHQFYKIFYNVNRGQPGDLELIDSAAPTPAGVNGVYQKGAAGANGNFYVDLDGREYINQGNPSVGFTVRFYKNSDYTGLYSPPGGANTVFNTSMDCKDDPVNFNLAADCKIIFMQGLGDADGPVTFRINNTGATYTSAGDFAIDHGITASSNAGYDVSVTAYNTPPSGPGAPVTQPGVTRTYAVRPPNFDCYEDPPDLEVTMDCKNVYINKLNDVDANGQPVSYSGSINHGSGGSSAMSINGSGNGSVTIPYNAADIEDGINDGFNVTITAQSIGPKGPPPIPPSKNTTKTANTNGACFAATCTIKLKASTVPTAPKDSNTVDARAPFTLEYSIKNTGRLDMPGTMNGNGGKTSITNDNKSVYDQHQDGRGVPKGQTIKGEFQAGPLNKVGSYDLSSFPSYIRSFRLGPNCTPPPPPPEEHVCQAPDICSYDEFELGATADVAIDNEEDPTDVDFYRSITQVTPPKKNGPALPGWNGARADSTVYALYRPYTGGVQEVAGNSPGGPGNRGYNELYKTVAHDVNNYNPTGSVDIKRGDKFCSQATVMPKTGWADTTGYVRDGKGKADSGEYCRKIVDEPYLRVYGNDVAVGGGFGENCSENPGLISTFTKVIDSGPGRGSGAQLAAFAVGIISGFPTATTRTSQPTGPVGLTFANTTNLNGNLPNSSNRPNTGGNFKKASCASDYFSDTQYPDGPDKKVLGSNFTGSVGNLPAPQTVAKGASISGTVSGSKTLYVDGDVFISGNILYGSTSWTDLSDIPNFSLIVRGNINIAANVTQLNGMYVAQPKADGGGGIITTCATSSGPISVPSLEQFCNSQLVINGSFIAQKINFYRTSYTLRDSPPNEISTSSDAKAAERFNFSPEAYLSTPALRPLGGNSKTQYDFITTLPPIL